MACATSSLSLWARSKCREIFMTPCLQYKQYCFLLYILDPFFFLERTAIETESSVSEVEVLGQFSSWYGGGTDRQSCLKLNFHSVLMGDCLGCVSLDWVNHLCVAFCIKNQKFLFFFWGNRPLESFWLADLLLSIFCSVTDEHAFSCSWSAWKEDFFECRTHLESFGLYFQKKLHSLQGQIPLHCHLMKGQKAHPNQNCQVYSSLEKAQVK